MTGTRPRRWTRCTPEPDLGGVVLVGPDGQEGYLDAGLALELVEDAGLRRRLEAAVAELPIGFVPAGRGG